jgi:flagellar hook-length control protein FliK
MTNQLSPLLESNSNNRVSRSSSERAVDSKDQGFSRTFQEVEKKLAANKIDTQATRETRSEKQELSTNSKQSIESEPVDEAGVSSADANKIATQTASGQVEDNTEHRLSYSADHPDKGALAVSAENNLDVDKTDSLLVNAVDVAGESLLISSELASLNSAEIQALLEGLNEQLASLGVSSSSEVTVDPAAFQQLADELFVDSSQLPLGAIAEIINKAVINQPLTVSSAADLINDLNKFAQLSSATETTRLKFNSTLTSQGQLQNFIAASVNDALGVSGSGIYGERPEKLTLQVSTDIVSANMADKFSADKLNLTQLLNSKTTASELSASKSPTEASPLQALANVPLSNVVAGAKPQLTVGIPFQQTQWSEAVAERVMWMSSKGLQEAEIHLNPADLGPIQVKVSLVADQAHVSFVVSNASVREALDQNAIRLREMFNGEGLNLVDVDVSDQSQHQASNSEDDRSKPHFNGERSELGFVQGENQLSVNANGRGMLSLYA